MSETYITAEETDKSWEDILARLIERPTSIAALAYITAQNSLQQHVLAGAGVAAFMAGVSTAVWPDRFGKPTTRDFEALGANAKLLVKYGLQLSTIADAGLMLGPPAPQTPHTPNP